MSTTMRKQSKIFIHTIYHNTTYAYPEAEIVVPPSTAVLFHCCRGGGVSQVMVTTDKHQRDRWIRPLQRSLQVSFLTFSKRSPWGDR